MHIPANNIYTEKSRPLSNDSPQQNFWFFRLRPLHATHIVSDMAHLYHWGREYVCSIESELLCTFIHLYHLHHYMLISSLASDHQCC